MHSLAVSLTGTAQLLAAIPLDTATTALKNAINPIAQDAVNVMIIAIPVIAIFRIIYRFAESREGSLMVLITEVVLIIFVSFAVGMLLKVLLSSFFKTGTGT